MSRLPPRVEREGIGWDILRVARSLIRIADGVQLCMTDPNSNLMNPVRMRLGVKAQCPDLHSDLHTVENVLIFIQFCQRYVQPLLWWNDARRCVGMAGKFFCRVMQRKLLEAHLQYRPHMELPLAALLSTP